MSYQICGILFSITWFKQEKSCKSGVNHKIKIGASVYSGSSYDFTWSALIRDDVITQSRKHAYSVAGVCLYKKHYNLFTQYKHVFRYIISSRTFWSTHLFYLVNVHLIFKYSSICITMEHFCYIFLTLVLCHLLKLSIGKPCDVIGWTDWGPCSKLGIVDNM